MSDLQKLYEAQKKFESKLANCAIDFSKYFTLEELKDHLRVIAKEWKFMELNFEFEFITQVDNSSGYENIVEHFLLVYYCTRVPSTHLRYLVCTIQLKTMTGLASALIHEPKKSYFTDGKFFDDIAKGVDNAFVAIRK